MTGQAEAVPGAVLVVAVERCGGTICLICRCEGMYEQFCTLPDAVSFQGEIYGKTGWNSDRGQAYYKNTANVAFAVKGVR